MSVTEAYLWSSSQQIVATMAVPTGPIEEFNRVRMQEDTNEAVESSGRAAEGS